MIAGLGNERAVDQERRIERHMIVSADDEIKAGDGFGQLLICLRAEMGEEHDGLRAGRSDLRDQIGQYILRLPRLQVEDGVDGDRRTETNHADAHIAAGYDGVWRQSGRQVAAAAFHQVGAQQRAAKAGAMFGQDARPIAQDRSIAERLKLVAGCCQ